MKQTILTVTDNQPLTGDIFRLRLTGDVSGVTAPGEFVDIEIPGYFLRRPISVSAKRDGSIELIVKKAGEGTGVLGELPPGSTLNVLTGLGQGFHVSRAGQNPLILAGGVGTAPTLWLIDELLSMGTRPTAILGFGGGEEAAALCSLIPTGVRTIIATMDGSAGVRGNVADALREAGDYSYFYVSGPTAMMKALRPLLRGRGEYSLEQRMGCGYGACMGCTIMTVSGPRRVCADGPVFGAEELIWDD